jgi:uncharacterized protein YkwD
MFCPARHLAFLLVLAPVPIVWAEEKKSDEKKDTKDEFKLSADERALIDLTNAERKNADKELPPLKPNEKLTEAARKHAENMAAQEILEHELDGKNPDDRVKATGYKPRVWGENIAEGQRTPKDAIAVWMGSPPHRENILSTEFTEIGVAVAKSKTGTLYWVEVFGTR